MYVFLEYFFIGLQKDKLIITQSGIKLTTFQGILYKKIILKSIQFCDIEYINLNSYIPQGEIPFYTIVLKDGHVKMFYKILISENQLHEILGSIIQIKDQKRTIYSTIYSIYHKPNRISYDKDSVILEYDEEAIPIQFKSIEKIKLNAPDFVTLKNGQKFALFGTPWELEKELSVKYKNYKRSDILNEND